MIGATVFRALVLTVAVAAAPTPCFAQAGTDKSADKSAEKSEKKAPRLPAKATKELPAEMLALFRQRKMAKSSPILIRTFKEESELEVWKQDATGRFQLIKTYPVCRWSGDLGPKFFEGDRQTPEGFYTVTPGLMNPHSSFYLAINTGYPNSFDKANGRDGSFLMIHGDCWSSGCFAMTDEQISEIYAMARDALAGRPSFQVQAYPFRMTPANLARHRNSPHLPFWQMLKVGNDHFETTRLEPKVDVCDRRYVFDAQAKSGKSFKPTDPCPDFVVNPKIAQAALEKQRADEREVARLVAANVPAAPVYSALDGSMHEVFRPQLGSRIMLSRMTPLNEMPDLPPIPFHGKNGSLMSEMFGPAIVPPSRGQAAWHPVGWAGP